jgi:ABC-type bacteriocin/lantibiotic exporter with double-glycine peptidase domain
MMNPTCSLYKEYAQLSSYLIESLNGTETVKAFNSEREANLQTERKFVRLERTILFVALYIYFFHKKLLTKL